MEPRRHHSPSISISQVTDKPLFGVATRRDSVLNISFGVLTSLLVMATVVSAFIFPTWPPNGINIFFAVCITLMSMSHIMLVEAFMLQLCPSIIITHIHWYNEGGVDPKFRLLIYYNTFLIALFCACANCYYHLHLQNNH